MLMWQLLYIITGAGVSEAAGIQTFRGPGGLFSEQGNKRDMLELFDKDTFQVSFFFAFRDHFANIRPELL